MHLQCINSNERSIVHVTTVAFSQPQYRMLTDPGCAEAARVSTASKNEQNYLLPQVMT
jgi:hypothetical protein